ncbi:MAG: hypothetical protein AB8B91_23820, partial [Rubripirellula sp.]
PFSLVANALAAIRTEREGDLGRRIEQSLSQENFRGLRIVSTGEIPQGGFSSSSAMTVAVINAIDALYELQMDNDTKVRLACRAEYGTGVRAGALDQATEQTGRYGQGALISSNPKQHYRVLGTFVAPTDRIRVLFPNSVDRDREAWQWSAGVYASTAGDRLLTTGEVRKMTGKAAEIAAILLRLPLDVDFFEELESELVESGELTAGARLHVRDTLAKLPQRATQTELRNQLEKHIDWYVDQQRMTDPDYTRQHAEETFESLLDGWRDPVLRRTQTDGVVVEEVGAPLRAMLGYLYAEVAKNCYLIHHPEQWIEFVTRSQRGDKCFEIDHARLPDRQTMFNEIAWERDVFGWQRMRLWLDRWGALPFNFNAGLEDADLLQDDWSLLSIGGTNFFRGLAIIDLAEAMLKRAFGDNAVAVRINGAGQGDYFQVHVDTQLADVDEIKDFIREAIYKRFDLAPAHEFVEPHPGGGAVSLRLNHFGQIPSLVDELSEYWSAEATPTPRTVVAK